MKILKKIYIYFFYFFFEIRIFFFKLGKKSPKSHWERGRISAPEDTKKNPCYGMLLMSEIDRLFHAIVANVSQLYYQPSKHVSSSFNSGKYNMQSYSCLFIKHVKRTILFNYSII